MSTVTRRTSNRPAGNTKLVSKEAPKNVSEVEDVDEFDQVIETPVESSNWEDDGDVESAPAPTTNGKKLTPLGKAPAKKTESFSSNADLSRFTMNTGTSSKSQKNRTETEELVDKIKDGLKHIGRHSMASFEQLVRANETFRKNLRDVAKMLEEFNHVPYGANSLVMSTSKFIKIVFESQLSLGSTYEKSGKSVVSTDTPLSKKSFACALSNDKYVFTKGTLSALASIILFNNAKMGVVTSKTPSARETAIYILNPKFESLFNPLLEEVSKSAKNKESYTCKQLTVALMTKMLTSLVQVLNASGIADEDPARLLALRENAEKVDNLVTMCRDGKKKAIAATKTGKVTTAKKTTAPVTKIAEDDFGTEEEKPSDDVEYEEVEVDVEEDAE